jgi:hypothetical protein
MEHFVYYMGVRWVRITQGSVDGCGYTVGLLDDEPAVVRATASEYLDRLQLANEVFMDDTVLHGVSLDHMGNAILITSQPDYAGDPAEIQHIQTVMRSSGFKTLHEPGSFYRREDNVAIMDLHPENAVRDERFLYVFDAIITQPDSELLAAIERILARNSGDFLL